MRARRYRRKKTVLPETLVADILRRLALGHAIRAIGRELQIARETVRAFDRGAHEAETKVFKRCGVCGHSVLLPCRMCGARACGAVPVAA